MSSKHSSNLGQRPQVSVMLLGLMLLIIWLSGGSSRADVIGQPVARFAAWGVLAIAALCAVRPDFRACKPVLWLALGIIALPALQLIPLPPSVWMSAAGMEVFSSGYELTASSDSFRPLSVSPGATFNALSSLVIPTTILVLMASTRQPERSWVVSFLFILIIISMLIGLLQTSGAGFANPLVNHVNGMVSGVFANRNHFALLLALGCLIAPMWALMGRDQLSWRIPLAMGVVLLAELTILATGSRAGIAVGLLSLILGPLVIHENISRTFRNTSRWILPSVVSVFGAIICILVFISFVSGRAVSIDRLAEIDVGADMRSVGMPTVLEIILANLPLGVGMGGFDAIFRLWEPDEILRTLYFNHAHSDWLELILEGGVFSLALMAAALLWWSRASLRVWRRSKSNSHVEFIGRLGSAMILLVSLASVVDYPARTPLMMAVIVIAACWLAWGEHATRDGASLRKGRRLL